MLSSANWPLDVKNGHCDVNHAYNNSFSYRILTLLYDIGQTWISDKLYWYIDMKLGISFFFNTNNQEYIHYQVMLVHVQLCIVLCFHFLFTIHVKVNIELRISITVFIYLYWINFTESKLNFKHILFIT
jgi:hypothetical protein